MFSLTALFVIPSEGLIRDALKIPVLSKLLSNVLFKMINDLEVFHLGGENNCPIDVLSEFWFYLMRPLPDP